MRMYNESFKGYLMGYGGAISVVLFLIALTIIRVYFRQLRKVASSWPTRRSSPPRPAVHPVAGGDLHRAGCLAVLFLARPPGCCCRRSRPPTSPGRWTIPSSCSRQLLGGAGQPGRARYFVNTVLVTAPAGSLDRAGALAGYVFAKLPFRGSNLLFLVIVSGMFFPPQVILIPCSGCSTPWT